MTNPQTKITVSIMGLDQDLAQDLIGALEANACDVEFSESTRKTLAEMVFCPANPAALAKARRLNPSLPIVVISRVPEVSIWLDALEAGAADYCAPPFEAVQLRWLLDTHLAVRRSAAVAA